MLVFSQSGSLFPGHPCSPLRSKCLYLNGGKRLKKKKNDVIKPTEEHFECMTAISSCRLTDIFLVAYRLFTFDYIGLYLMHIQPKIDKSPQTMKEIHYFSPLLTPRNMMEGRSKWLTAKFSGGMSGMQLFFITVKTERGIEASWDESNPADGVNRQVLFFFQIWLNFFE